MKNTHRQIIVTLVIAIAVYISLVIWGNLDDLIEIFTLFPWIWLIPILLLVISSQIMRFLKWQYFLKKLDITIPWPHSLRIYLSGFTMAITPGKVGEVLKSYLLKQHYNIPFSRTAPAVFVDRLTDLIGYLLIAAMGAVAFQYGYTIIIVIACIISLTVVGLLWRSLAEAMLSRLAYIRVLHKHIDKIRNLYESSYTLLKPKYLLFPVLISFLAWLLECVAFFVVIIGVSQTTSALAAIFIYAFSAIIGAVSMLPGGLGSTEVTMASMLNTLAIPKNEATAIVLLIRASTLWFAIFIGMIALAIEHHHSSYKSSKG